MGARIVILDEACLIRDDTEATIYRMIAGKGKKAVYIKIGNPFYKRKPYSHFYKTSNDNAYKKIWIDYIQGIKEGRYSEEFIAEAKEKPMFDVLFEVKYPEGSEIDDQGYRLLIKENELNSALEEGKAEGELKLGFDVSEGGDKNVGVIRGLKHAKTVHISHISDLMAIVGVIHQLIKEYAVKPENCFIDATGIEVRIS